MHTSMISPVRPPLLIRKYYSKLIWNIPSAENEVYLTFDDGPIPGVTEFVLDTLFNYSIKATFFCIGENVSNHPGVYSRIIQEGHSVGNHTWSHLNGWKSDLQDYLENVEKAGNFISSKLFRPP